MAHRPTMHDDGRRVLLGTWAKCDAVVGISPTIIMKKMKAVISSIYRY